MPPFQPSPPNNEDLPITKRLITDLLCTGLDMVGGVHTPSWVKGHELANEQHALRERERDSTTRIVIEYRPDTVATVPKVEEKIFSDQGLPTSAESKSRMRADCSRYLPPDQQPTIEQFKAIFTGAPVTSVSGAAGTGKTFSILLRVVYLHLYLNVPLGQITILTIGREARQELATELQSLFTAWNHEVSPEVALRVVKTPRTAIAQLVRSLPGLESAVPFEAISDGFTETLIDNGPVEAGLNPRQLAEMQACMAELYKSNARFAELIQVMYATSLRLPHLGVDDPDVIRRAAPAWKLSEFDNELCDVVERLWSKKSMWPLEGIVPVRKTFNLRGRHYNTQGFIPELNMHVVLGFDRSEDRFLTRSPSSPEIYKEVAIKKTLLQGYFGEDLIHLDSYEQAKSLAAALKQFQKAPPVFSYLLKGAPKAKAVLELFYDVALLIDNLGLDVATAPGRLNFQHGDSDAAFFEALGIFWLALERNLARLPEPCFAFGRLFDLLNANNPGNLRHVPVRVLGCYRHVLIDTAEDFSKPVAGWLRGLFAEIHRRDSLEQVVGELCCSLYVAGDHAQWIYGRYGTSPKMLTDIEELFPSGRAVHIQLLESYRSHQQIVDAGQSLIRDQSTHYGRSTRAAGRAARDPAPVEIGEMSREALLGLCLDAFKDNRQVLVLIDNQYDREQVDQAIGDLIREDRAAGSRRIRVRTFHKAKTLQSDVVILVGDPSAGKTVGYRNQLYRLAGYSAGGDTMPGDTVMDGEAMRLAYVAITRAKRRAYWFPNREDGVRRTASTLIPLSDLLFSRK